MKQSFGARLRQEREQRGIPLSEISRQTKIKVSLLDALERDDLSYWPQGLFGRAYIRAYAQAIRVDPEPVMREFTDLHPDPPDELFEASLNTAATPAGRIWRAVASAIGANTPPPRESSPTATLKLTETALPARRPAHRAPDVSVVARLCLQLQQAEYASDLVPLLGEIARLLEANGIVLWAWDSNVSALQPWLTHGYAPQVADHLPLVRRDEDNAIASAFRAVSPRVVGGGEGRTGAIVVPVVVSSRCIGALSLELCDGREQRMVVRDAASIFAAVLARFLDEIPLAAVVNG